MNNLQEIQRIKRGVMDSQGCSNDKAVRYIAGLVCRSPKTVYEWLSNNRPNIPNQLLELLKLKL